MNETIDIKRRGTTIYSALITAGCKRTFSLMEDDSVTLQFSIPYSRAIIFEMGDTCEYKGQTFMLMERSKPTYASATGGYSYTLKFVAEYMTWKRFVMKTVKVNGKGEVSFGETKWDYTANLKNHALAIMRMVMVQHGYSVDDDALLNNIVLDGLEQFEEYKHISYNGTNVIEALNKLCGDDMYDCEWWFVYKNYEYELHFGRLGASNQVSKTFTSGLDADITRNDSKYEYANRLYVYGNTQNIPYSYRKSAWFSNSRTDGKLYDATRALKYDMFTNGHRVTDFDFDIHSQDEIITEPAERDTFINMFNLGHVVGNVSGKFKLDISNLVLEVNCKAENEHQYGYLTGITAELCIHAIDATNTEIAVVPDFVFTPSMETINGSDINKYYGTTSKYDSFEDETFDINEEVRALFITLKVTATMPLEWKDNTKKLEVKVTSNGSKITRIDYYEANAVITRMRKPTETDEISVSIPVLYRESSHFKIKELIPSSTIDPAYYGVGMQYLLGGMTYIKVPTSFYTSDNGEDIINGMTEKRLQLPRYAVTEEGYVCENGCISAAVDSEQIVEKVVELDEIYPAIMSMPVEYVDDSETRTAQVLFPDSSSSEREYPIYKIKARITDTQGTKYDFKRDYLLDGTALQMKFRTGRLRGMTFDVNCDFDKQIYTIVPNTDFGMLIPNKDMRPNVYDEVILLGWDTKSIDGLGLVEDAEERLLEAAREELTRAYKGSYSYKVSAHSNTSNIPMSLYDAENVKLYDKNGAELFTLDRANVPLLEMGDKVVLNDPSMFENGSSEPLRVIAYEKKLDYEWDMPQYTVGEMPRPSRLRTLEYKVK